MIPSAVLGRYARSLVDIVIEGNEEDAVRLDLATYREIFHAAPELLDAFHSPAIPREAKEKVLSSLLGRYPVRVTTANFLRVMLDYNRIKYFGQIVEAFIRNLNERKGIVEARVSAAAPLTESQLASLKERFTSITGKTITLDVVTDPTLVGGVVVQIGSTVYDGSVRTQLAEMKRRLAES
jgi:F-type H+-transporting ATPase subunit delta